LTKAVSEKLRAPTSSAAPIGPFHVWYDERLQYGDLDFSPTIHAELLDSDAVLFMFSPDFFDSPWCVHELHFAIGQHETRAMPLFWCWCDPTADAHTNPQENVRVAVERWKEKYLSTRQRIYGPEDASYHRNHVEERMGKVLALGRCLHTDVLRAPSAGDQESLEEAVEPLVKTFLTFEEYLRSRAVLPKAS
jgi:hypothetical protein